MAVETLEARTLLATLSVDISCCGATSIYCQLQDAVDAASVGDTIRVTSGTYKSVLIETKNITIREANRNSNPVIDATLSPLRKDEANDNGGYGFFVDALLGTSNPMSVKITISVMPT